MTRMPVFVGAMILALIASVHAQPEAEFPHGDMDRDCEECHSEDSWQIPGRPDRFDHGVTGFVLEGEHVHAFCRDCHLDLNFPHVGTQCADCHADIHRGRLGPVCSDCHSPAGWVDRERMRRDHDATAFPLVGAHERVDCDVCHRGPIAGDYVGTPRDCYVCHAADYHATTDPDHADAGFDTDCVRCHGVYAATWSAADFLHPASFPLTGAHAALDCSACHPDGFVSPPTDCYACHQSDYEGTSDPDHLASGFSTDCAACHTTNAWEPSTWDHNLYFPIYSGRHAGEWSSCTDCHVYSTFLSFECIFCHEHDETETTSHHTDVSGYVYLSSECLRCHPNGEAEEGGDD